MNNVLAALFGGAGAGLQSYGGARMQEQERERMAQQRMAELQQQEASRIAQAREAATLRAQLAKEEGEQAAVIARAMGLELPAGARLNTAGVGVLGQFQQNKRAAEAEAGRNSRFTEGLQGRLDQIDRTMSGQQSMLQMRLDAERALNEARIRELEARTNRAGQPPQGKPLPNAVMQNMIDNTVTMSRIDSALDAVKATPTAVGPTNLGPMPWLKNTFGFASPDEVATRADIGDIGSMVIHDRSGAAVTVSEYPRLVPFIPLASDPPQVVQTKLARMRRIIEEEDALYRANYGADQGFIPFRGGAQPVAPRRPNETPEQYMARIRGGR